MATNKTSISLGLMVYRLLSESPAVGGMATKVFPVAASQEARLPYVVFRTVRTEQRGVSPVAKANDTAEVEVLVCAADYEEGVRLAEDVRGTLDNKTATAEGLTMRSCMMTDRSETWEDDAYVQLLTFTLRI